jgi:hypothetical protein
VIAVVVASRIPIPVVTATFVPVAIVVAIPVTAIPISLVAVAPVIVSAVSMTLGFRRQNRRHHGAAKYSNDQRSGNQRFE